jgi:hypothetical protein
MVSNSPQTIPSLSQVMPISTHNDHPYFKKVL